ncbi:MAG: chorismate-binding protein [Thermoanaerobaculia bacterium]
MPRDFAFVETSPGNVVVGWGPFEERNASDPAGTTFFINDFFMDDSRPWKQPAEVEELSIRELADRFDAGPEPRMEWSAPPFDEFEPLLRSAQTAIARGEFGKIVPVVFERGTQRSAPTPPWRYLLSRLAALPPGLRAYGYSVGGYALIGATPEVLFQGGPCLYRTMALAGTRPARDIEELLTDAKEQREHLLVVEDIVRRLSPLGNVEVGPLGLMRLPGIGHLVTPIFFAGGETSFETMVRRLHPTAALGVSPRTEEGERWLRESDRGIGRKGFGAPFGICRADGTSLAVVAIRNVEWTGATCRIGSGAGLLAESDLRREFEELRQKREHVKALFGLKSAGDERWGMSHAPVN